MNHFDYKCDILIVEYNLIVEIDGDYWHANPKIYGNKVLTKTQKMSVIKDRKQETYE